FLPEPQGQDALRATLPQVAGLLGSTLGLVRGRCSVATPAPPVGSAGSNAGSSACRVASAGSSWISRIWAGGGGGCSILSCKVASTLVTYSRRPVNRSLNRLKASRLYSFSGSFWP